MLFSAHKVSLLNPTQGYNLNHTNLTKRWLGRATKALTGQENVWKLKTNTRNNTSPLKRSWGINTPLQEKLVVSVLANPVRPGYQTG